MSTADDEQEEQLLRGYSGRIAILVALGWMAILLGRQAIPPLLPTIIDDLAISPTRAGFALTLMMALYSLLQYPGGRLSDALSRTTVLVGSLGGTIVGFGVLATAGTYPQLLLGAGLVGVGSGLFFTPSRAFLSDLFVEKRGQAYGMQEIAAHAGSASSAGIAVAALAVATWQTAFLPAILLLAVVLVLLHHWSREPYVLSDGSLGLDVRATLKRLWTTPGIARPMLVRALIAFTFQAVIGFLPTFLQVEKGFSSTLASGSFAVVFVVGSVSGPLAGRLSDRMPRLRVVLGGLGLCLLGLVGMLVTDLQLVVGLGIVTMAAGITAVFPVIQAYLMDVFPDASIGGDFGAAKTIYTGLGSLGPTYVGLVASRTSYSMAFAGIALMLTLCVGFMLVRGLDSGT